MIPAAAVQTVVSVIIDGRTTFRRYFEYADTIKKLHQVSLVEFLLFDLTVSNQRLRTGLRRNQ